MVVESAGAKLLASAAWEALKGLWGYLFKYGPGDIEKLEKKMEELSEDLQSVSDLEDPAERTNKWIVDARELVCDMEDLVGKCKHPGDKEVETDDKIKKKVQEITERIKSTPRYISLSRVIGEAVNDVAAVESRYKKVNMALGGGRPDLRYGPLLKQGSHGLVGIDSPKEEIIRLLDIADVPRAVDDKSGKSIGHIVVSIVGAGGLGKTTLAGQVSYQIHEQFHCEARVFVSRDRPREEILITLLQEFGAHHHDLGNHHVSSLVRLIQKHVENKRFLVVFDDVWNNDLLEDINNALLGNQGGGRIIITTRKTDVAKEWCSSVGDHVYQIKPLNDKNSRSLLLQKVKTIVKPQTSKEYIEKILAKCSGSPLALAAASGLAVQQTGRTIRWDEVYQIMGRTEGHHKIQSMRKVLSLSYFDLPYHKRDCLLYLSLFPNNEINKKRLMSRWIAEGLIDKEEARQTFDELINSNLIQPPKIKYDGDESTYQVHRTIHDFAVWKSAEYNFVTLSNAIDQTDRKIRRISVHKNTEGRGDIKLNNKKFPHLRSLSMLGPGDLPEKMSSVLRVVDLENCKNADIKFWDLFHHNLQYLKLREGLRGHKTLKPVQKYLATSVLEGFVSPDNVKKIVKSKQDLEGIESAGYLRTLDLRGLGKVILDTAITKLRFLTRLLVDPETTLPHGIGRMEALEELEFISVLSYDLKFFEELGELPKLRAVGIYLFADSPSTKVSQLLTSLLKLAREKGLRSLFIDGDRSTSIPIVHRSLWGQVVEHVRKFRVRCTFSVVPELTKPCQRLERVRLGVPVTSVQEELDNLAYFSSHLLTHLFLDLSGCPQGVTIFSCSKRFQYLMCLGIRSASLSMTVKFSMGAPQHLKLQLDADDCKEPEDLPVGFNYATTPTREGNDNNQVVTTWTTVHITTPRLRNENKEVVVVITIASRSATLSITENGFNSHNDNGHTDTREDLTDNASTSSPGHGEGNQLADISTVDHKWIGTVTPIESDSTAAPRQREGKQLASISKDTDQMVQNFKGITIREPEA
ncbi:hypothetical protein ACP70R_025883 [Stipagrostis hirtigluma subsp. patula]